MRFTPGFLLLLLLISDLPPVHGILETYYTNLKCKCPKVTSGPILLKESDRLEILRPGNGCPKKEIILWRKKGKGICLNPQAKWIKELLRRLLKSD